MWNSGIATQNAILPATVLTLKQKGLRKKKKEKQQSQCFVDLEGIPIMLQ